MEGSNNNFNIVYCCPNCHSRIYVDPEVGGIHGKEIKESIKIIRWYNNRRILEIIHCNTNKTELIIQ